MNINFAFLSQAIRNVGFYGEGHVALHNFALPPKTGFSFTFASKQEDAVMLSAGQMENAGRRKKDVDSDLTDVSHIIIGTPIGQWLYNQVISFQI